jgi:hypothetical protein
MFNISLGDYNKKYTLIKTNALRSYDYGYVIPIQEYSHEGKLSRWVLIPTDLVSTQCGRYSSGLFSSEPDDDISLVTIGEILYKRLTLTEKE